MEALKLIGVLIVVVGFILKKDTLAVVVLAGIVTGVVARMSFMEILETLGSSYLSQRVATVFVLSLPAIGLCERYGLKDKAVDLIHKLKNATTGVINTVYMGVRLIFSAMSVRIGGYVQFVRPITHPMAQAAAHARYGELDDKGEDEIKGACSAAESYGNFFGQNVFVGNSGTMLIVAVLVEQGLDVTAIQIALWSIPICIATFIVGGLNNYRLDKKMDRKYGKKSPKGGVSA